MSIFLEEIEPVHLPVNALKELHPLERKAVAVLGFEINPPQESNKFEWLWHHAPIDTRCQVLSALWGYAYVRSYLYDRGVVPTTEKEQGESLCKYATRKYSELPEAIRYLMAYADGDEGFQPTNVREHGLLLLSKTELNLAMSRTVIYHSPGAISIVDAGWGEN